MIVTGTRTVNQFREKYGKSALTMEEDFAHMIEIDMYDFEHDPEAKQREFKTMSNQEMFFEFIDYICAFTEYNDIFFLLTPSGEQYYAYTKNGKKNILKYLSDKAENYKKESKRLEQVLKEVSTCSCYAIIPIDYKSDGTFGTALFELKE